MTGWSVAIGGACARGPSRKHTALLTWTFTPPQKTRSLPCLSQELKKQELRASGGMAISANQMLSALAEKEREKQKKKALKREQKVRDAPHILLTSAVSLASRYGYTAKASRFARVPATLADTLPPPLPPAGAQALACEGQARLGEHDRGREGPRREGVPEEGADRTLRRFAPIRASFLPRTSLTIGSARSLSPGLGRGKAHGEGAQGHGGRQINCCVLIPKAPVGPEGRRRTVHSFGTLL